MVVPEVKDVGTMQELWMVETSLKMLEAGLESECKPVDALGIFVDSV